MHDLFYTKELGLLLWTLRSDLYHFYLFDVLGDELSTRMI